MLQHSAARADHLIVDEDDIPQEDIDALFAATNSDDEEEEEPDFELPPEVVALQSESPPKVVQVADFRAVPRIAVEAPPLDDEDGAADDEGVEPTLIAAAATLPTAPAAAITPSRAAEAARLQAIVDRRERRIEELHEQVVALQAEMGRMARRLERAQKRTPTRARGGRGSLWSAERYLAAATSGEWRLP